MNNSKKSKAEKMTGSQNGEISKTFKRKSPGYGVTPYDLTISTEPNDIINLEIKITSNNLPFTKFKESFSDPLVPVHNSNATNIVRIKNHFDKHIEITTFLGKKFVVNDQTILFKFNLKSDNSTVTINGIYPLAIKTKFKDVLFNLYSNNKLNYLTETNKGNTFKNVITNITKKNNQQIQSTKKQISVPVVPYNLR